MPDPMLPQPRRVRRVQRETGDTYTLTVEAPPHGFAPGQFNMIAAFGIGEVPISMSGDPGKPGQLVHTVRAVGPVTTAICRARRGEVLGVRGPYGRPWPVAECQGRDVVIVAGGLGLAPLRPAVYHLLRHRSAYGRVVLLVGARAPEELLFRAELARWAGRGDLQVLVTVDRAGPEWTGEVGVVTALFDAAHFDGGSAVALVCGPEVMMRFAARALEQRGVSDDRIHCSLERNMKCAIGFCGHCQLGPAFLCKDGPVLRYDRVRPFFRVREL